MKFRSTLLLLVVAGALGSYIYFVERHRPSAKEAYEQHQKVLEVDRDRVNSVSIKNTETKIELRRKENNTWFLDDPVKDRADSMVMNTLFTTLESLKHSAVIGEGKGATKEQLKEFGFTNTETKIKLAGSDKPVELLLGKDAAVEGKLYAKLEGSDVVYVISNDLKNQLSKKVDDFRDRKLTDLTLGQISKAVIKGAGGEIELTKNRDHWSLSKPLNARGDDSKIGDVISQAITARIETFVADSANLAAYGLQEPRGTVSLFTESGKEPVVLQIGTNPKDEKEKEKTYAKLSTRDSVVLLPKSIEQVLETKPNDLRDKNLVRVESDIVDRITIEPAGKEKLVIARNGENWVRKDGNDVPVNNVAATTVLETLKTQQVVNFVADVATDLQKYGLDQPQVKVTLSSFASENTAETKAGEKPIVTVLFGKTDGENVYVKLDDEPFILAVHRAILDQIPTDPIQWQELTIYKFKPEEITTIEISKAGQPAIAIEREKDKWKLAKGDGTVNQVNANSAANTLAQLRAVRWSGATKPEDGLDEPKILVTFKTSSNTSGKLKFGAATPDELTNASADGLAGTFLVSRPDRDAFQMPLVDKPAAPAAAAPGAAPANPTAVTPAAAPMPAPKTEPVPAAPPAAPESKPATPQDGAKQ